MTDNQIAVVILSNGDVHLISECDKKAVDEAGPWHLIVKVMRLEVSISMVNEQINIYTNL